MIISLKDKLKNTIGFTVLFYIVFMFTFPLSAYAMLLDIPNAPLFLGQTIKPNVMLMVDDSGSMDWEILKRPGTEVLPGGGGFANSGNLDITPTRDDRDEIFESCVGYNTLYYDPTQTYTPWVGVDEDGVTFADQDITSARTNPFDEDDTIDLTDDEGFGDPPGYMTWNDLDGDNEFDMGECPDTDAPGYNYNTMFTATTDMSAAEQTNFANWYSYYRKREFIMKRAMTPLVRDFNMRMGLGTLHDNNNVGRPIRDLEDGSNRDILTARIVNINSSGGTPLRRRLRAAGRYYAGSLSGSDGLGFVEGSPILPEADGGMCQQNFTMLLSDGFWNGPGPGVGNDDGDNTSPYDGRSYADGFSNTLADVAMQFYEADLSGTLDNVVPISDSRDDKNPAQHMVTYTVSFGLNGTLAGPPPNFDDPFVWPEPLANNVTTADDMLHAAWNGRGQFLSANDPDQLITALSNVLNDIEARGGTAASAAANGGSISTESRVFQAQFDSTDWSGKLLSFKVNNDGTLAATAEWDAGEELNLRDPSSRRILFMDPTDDSVREFDWGAMTLAQKAMFDINPDSGIDDGLGEERVNALRGVNIIDPAIRKTDNVLGDLINSDPEFVGVPRLFFNFADYQGFFTSQQTRQSMIYVGGNDGMLHAFNTSGKEEWAYIPSEVFPRINDLTDPGYTHEFFVDGSPVHGDVQESSGSTNWKTILVSGLRSGGQGLFTLDITNPTTLDTTDVLFEFTDEDDADLGYTFAKPQIIRTNAGAVDGDPSTGKWAIVLGNGYNSTLNDGSQGSGEAVLYIIFVDDAEDGSIDPGDVVKISAGNGTLADPNGMGSAGSADIDGDSRVDFIYAGDLKGNLWKFDVSSKTPASWEVANDPSPLFKAERSGIAQPITAPPIAIPHPLGINQGALIVVGTGKFLESDDIDPALQTTQTFYAVWDRDASPIFSDSTVVGRGQMTETSITTSGGNRFISSEAAPDWIDSSGTPVNRGWFLDLPESGERMIRPAISRSGVIFFVTLIPSMAPCVPGGTGFLMALDANTGGIPNPAQLPNPAVFDTNGDGVFDEFDEVGGDVVIGLEQGGIPAEPAVIFDPRPFCERFPTSPECDTDGDGVPDVAVGNVFPPPLNTFRGCGSDGTRIYLYTTTSNGNISSASASMTSISCGRQAWRQIR